MTGRMEIIGTQAAAEWRRRIRDMPHDFYHLPEYHRLAERAGEGKAALFAYSEGGANILMPLLLRPIATVDGLERAGSGLFDATSVYGYPGPLTEDGMPPSSAIGGFQRSLTNALQDMKVVSVFSRTHPLISNLECLRGLGEIRHQGRTVSMDLAIADDEAFHGFRPNHRRNIKNLIREGYTSSIESVDRSKDEFIEIYHQNMKRVNSSSEYFFGRKYFDDLMKIDGISLMSCRKNGIMTAGAILSHTGVIAQYHLGATCDDWLKQAPMKLVFNEARRWARERGCSLLHLGGGLGSSEDALFHFKAGFSNRFHTFSTWRWIVAPERYRTLQAERRIRFPLESDRPDNFFPAYRSRG